VNNPSTITCNLTGLILSAIGGGDDQTGISSVQIWLDADGDGIVDGSDSLLGSAVYNGNNGTATFTFDTSVAGGAGVTLLLVDDFSSTATDGTYQTGINAGGLSGTCVSGACQFSGLPVTGAVITIAHATETHTLTPTSTRTASPTPTRTSSMTPTASLTATRTFTSTPTRSWTSTPTDTPVPTETPNPTLTETSVPTATATLTGNTKPIIYPNPSDGRPVNILPPLTKVSDVKVQIFTLAFRKANETTFPQVPPGVSVTITLTDYWNKPLANGLYYVVVITDEGRTVSKLLIVR
jgi:hypothetical protein